MDTIWEYEEMVLNERMTEQCCILGVWEGMRTERPIDTLLESLGTSKGFAACGCYDGFRLVSVSANTAVLISNVPSEMDLCPGASAAF